MIYVTLACLKDISIAVSEEYFLEAFPNPCCSLAPRSCTYIYHFKHKDDKPLGSGLHTCYKLKNSGPIHYAKFAYLLRRAFFLQKTKDVIHCVGIIRVSVFYVLIKDHNPLIDIKRFTLKTDRKLNTPTIDAFRRGNLRSGITSLDKCCAISFKRTI